MIRSLMFLMLIAAPIFGQSEFAGTWNCAIDCPGGAIRFDLDVKKDRNGVAIGHIINGSERIKIPSVSIEGGDFVISFDHYDSSINGQIKDDLLNGIWKKRRGPKEWVEMDFRAQRQLKGNRRMNSNSRFDGRWKVQFAKSEDPAVGIFHCGEGGGLNGTFLTTTGDYRYLFGRQTEKQFELSCFDGAHAFLFKAEFDGEGLVGDFWSSNTWHEKWTAVRDDQAKLPDAFEQTSWKKDTSLASYSFRNLAGDTVSLADPKFRAPVKLIYVFGSWCPNCHDAALYFKELKEKYGDKIKIVGLAFEHTGDFARDSNQVKNYLKRNSVDYSVLLGGTSNKKKASQAVPFLDRVRSYPTTIFVDSNEAIRGVHTGFTGPATGDAYVELKTRFESLIDRVINE